MSQRINTIVLAVALIAAPAFAGTLYFDFGDPAQMTAGNYNNMTHNAEYPNPPEPILNAIDDSGAATGISLTCTDVFWPGTNYNGTTAPTGDAAMFDAAATRDSFFGSSVIFGDYLEPTGGFTLAGLDPSMAYTFTFFASRLNVSDNREAYYALAGNTADTVYLDPVGNTSAVVVSAAIVPDASGQITLEVGPGPNNTNSSHFYYLGAMAVEVVPEPSTALLLTLAAAALIRRR